MRQSEIEKLNGNDFNPDMFMYSLIVDKQLIDTKKMVLTE